jgi:hypothetical protein
VVVNSVEEEEKGITEEHKEPNMKTHATMKSKILTHFIKGKISLILMEPILIIPRD